MNITTKLVLGIIFFVVVISISGIIVFYEFDKLSHLITIDVPQDIEDVTLQSELDNAANFIRYYDEVLTQSARNYAFTTDTTWKERYLQNEPKLDEQIRNAIEKGNEIETKFFAIINEANQNLVQMEYDAIDFVDQGKPNDAIKILQSEEYRLQKGIYEEGLRNYLSARGVAYNEALLASSQTLDKAIVQTQSLVAEFNKLIVFLIIIISVLIILMGFFSYQSMIKPINKLIITTKEISEGKFDKRVKISGNNEFTKLGSAFNQMAESIEKSQTNLKLSHSIIEKQLEKIKEVDKQKSEFNSMMTHEFKTPLMPILGYSSMLLDQGNANLTTDQHEAIKEIKNNAINLEKMLDTILNVMKIEMNSLNFRNENFLIKQLVLKTIDTIKETKAKELEKKQIKIQLSVEDDFVVFADPEKISTIISVLVENAISFVSENGIIKIGTQHRESDILVYVQDNGIGIIEDVQKNLFEKKFYQVDMSSRRAHGGIGMSLVLCKLLIEKMKGQIWVESKIGMGSKFCFTIPLETKSIEALGAKM